MNYVRTLKRYNAVVRAYRRARAAYIDHDLNQYKDACLALAKKQNALIAEIKAYTARPANVRDFADDFTRGEWMIERGQYMIRRQQILTACRLLGVDSRDIKF